MDLHLSGRTAVVTGASRVIGLAVGSSGIQFCAWFCVFSTW
jgi:hypothetical protein